ncbi:hypothetical protein [Thiobacillus denitrificans]|uniref:hypothetical protein n=1 Tax=Thiobacillus denitrificans TaxID=36861 RepID=UPI00164F410B|nr:hypothetical protein [Thiobacillus denitrificans]
MVKKVRRANGGGVIRHTALVLVGCLFFIVGQVTPDLFMKVVLLAVARVLPYEPFSI